VTAPALEEKQVASFWDDFKRSTASDSPADWVARQIENPPEWGKTLSEETGGSFTHRSTFPGGVVGRLSLHGLAPHHRYILTLNGNPELAGNLLLPTPVPGLEEERYYDFAFIETDADGRYEVMLGVALPPGDYQVRLYVKDTADFKIVLYHDYFPFRVE
jgi:hypothetical protein